jgi:hypothetical protein
LRLEAQIDVPLHLLEERIDPLPEELPGGLGGLDVAPTLPSGARVEVIDVQIPSYVNFARLRAPRRGSMGAG